MVRYLFYTIGDLTYHSPLVYLSILSSIPAFDKLSLQFCKVYGIDKLDKNF